MATVMSTFIYTMLLQFHWNNPEQRSDYIDGSGITFFYEPKRRQYDAQGAAMGNFSASFYLIIPKFLSFVIWKSFYPPL